MKMVSLKAAALAMVIAAPTAAGVYVLTTGHNSLAPEEMRAEMVRAIVEEWGPHVEGKYALSAQDWARRMEPTFRSVDMQNLENAASANDFDAMTLALMGSASAPAKGRSGPASLGNSGTDLVYTPITPCRIVDTRLAGGKIPAKQSRSFVGTAANDFSAQGGNATSCGIPANASVLTAKITATNVSTEGYFTVYPTNETLPLASTLNYLPLVNTSNETHIKLCRPGCETQFSVYSDYAADVVIDVNGYYMEPEAVALDCNVATESGQLDMLTGVQSRQVDCPAGYAATGGGCGGPIGLMVSNSKPGMTSGRPTGWQCDLVGSSQSAVAYEVNATCCRVPGR